MIGREAYKNPWIFNQDFTYDNIEGKKKIIYSYINFLSNDFNKHFFNKNALFHIQNIFNGYEGSKKWRNLIAESINIKNLNNLLNFIECDNIKKL